MIVTAAHMQRKSFGNMQCPIARSLERVGEWWSILILRDAFHGLTRFDQFQKSLDIAPNMLARRLNALVESGLLERRRYSERPPRDEYVLTERGRDFRPVLWALLAWGNRHFAPEGASVVVVDRKTGAMADPVLVDGRPAGSWPSRSTSGPAARSRGRWRAPGDATPGHNRESRAHERPDAIARDVLAAAGAFGRTGAVCAKRAGVAALALAVAPGGGWYGMNGGPTGASSKAPTTPMSVATSPRSRRMSPASCRRSWSTDNQRVRAGPASDPAGRSRLQARTRSRRGGRRGSARRRLTASRAQYDLQQAIIRQQAPMIWRRKTARRRSRSQDARAIADLAQTSAGSRQDARTRGRRRPAGARRVAVGAGRHRCRKQQLVVLEPRSPRPRAIAQAEADLQTAQLNLGYTEIRSPIDGYVGNRAAQVGAYVSAGSYLLSVMPARGLWVDANFKEDQLARMAPGQPATIVADVLPGHVFHGHVASLAPGDRRGLQRDPGGERHRQFHQDRPARAGADRCWMPTTPSCGCCAPAFRPPRGVGHANRR